MIHWSKAHQLFHIVSLSIVSIESETEYVGAKNILRQQMNNSVTTTNKTNDLNEAKKKNSIYSLAPIAVSISGMQFHSQISHGK